MEIYRVSTSKTSPQIFPAPDPDAFFSALPSALSGKAVEKLECEGFQFELPRAEPAGFYRLSDRFLVFDRSIYLSEVGRLLGFAGEVIETTVFGLPDPVFFLDVTAQYNCLDVQRTEFFDRHGSKMGVDTGMGVKTPAFYPKLIGDSSIFRIPQKRASILVATSDVESSDDFYQVFSASGLSGLNFELIWRD